MCFVLPDRFTLIFLCSFVCLHVYTIRFISLFFHISSIVSYRRLGKFTFQRKSRKQSSYFTSTGNNYAYKIYIRVYYINRLCLGEMLERQKRIKDGFLFTIECILARFTFNSLAKERQRRNGKKK